MAKSITKASILLPVAILLLGAVFLIYILIRRENVAVKTTFEATDDLLYNPYIGFAPNAGSRTAVGDNTLAYVGLLWSELEPEEGVYDFETIAETYHFEEYKAAGKRLVLRFILDDPGDTAHRDIPEWLYRITGDGVDYDISYGKGYCPDYTNELLITAYEKAVAALGEYFADDDFVAYIEMGGLGHWGEWHIKTGEGLPEFPDEDTVRRYVEPFKEAFPDTPLLLRRPYTLGVDYDAGLYNDMTGNPESTESWMEWINEGGSYTEGSEELTYTANPNLWQSAPVGGEFTSALSYDEMLVDDLAGTLELIEDSHMTFIGPKVPHSENLDTYEDAVIAVHNRIGYRFRVDSMRLLRTVFTETLQLELVLANDGTAPFYQDWPVRIRVKAQGETYYPDVDLSLAEIMGGDSGTLKTLLPEEVTEENLTEIAVGIVNPTTMEPEVKLAMDCQEEEGWYILYTAD